MLERILIPLDGSGLAESVFTQIRRILFRQDAEIILVQAIDLSPADEPHLKEEREALYSRASKYLKALEGKLADQGVRVRSRVCEGRAAETVLRVAQEEHATLIAMSTHGRGGIPRLILGSVAEQVLRASPIPVLAVRSLPGNGSGSAPVGWSELSFKRILVAIEAGELSLELVPPAIELGRLFESKILLVHVCEGGPACNLPVPHLTKTYEQFRQAGIEVEPLMMVGTPASGILEACRKHGADLIAIATHGRSGVSRWISGSVAETVLRAAPVPLLIVRAPDAARGDSGLRPTNEEARA